MLSTSKTACEKYYQVCRDFCFYLDIQNNGVAKAISKRIADLGLRQEVFLSGGVTHVVRDGERWPGRRAGLPERAGCGRRRADAMLERVRALPDTHAPPDQSAPPLLRVVLSVQKAIQLLDKIYDTFFNAPQRRLSVKVFKGHFIKIEFLDRLCRPVYKEFEAWPEIPKDPDYSAKGSVAKKQTTDSSRQAAPENPQDKMTRKSRLKIKEREEKEPKGGFCEMCNVDYADVTLHRRSPHHLAFVRDHTNFMALDSLIASTDVTAFLDKAAPINGERRSLRKICNGDLDTKSKRSTRSQTPDTTINGTHSPRRQNGGLDEDGKRHNTRCGKRTTDTHVADERQYYKVVGVSTKLRSSGGFAAPRANTPSTCNGGSTPLVVKFKRVRRSELSDLCDAAEQFMFPKRASSSSSTGDDSEEEEEPEQVKKVSPHPPLSLERRRSARPVALKEESSDDDSSQEDRRPRKRRAPVAIKKRRMSKSTPPPKSPTPEPEPEVEIKPIREEVVDRCLKWEGGRLVAAPAVEQLEFAFESVPLSEPWFKTFKRQDEDKHITKNIPQYFALYSQSPKLPYEIGQLPPLKPNCCPLSDLVKREEKPGPSRSYGTRGNKKQKIRRRTAAALIAMEAHPRKSPREHASTLAILGSAGLLHRRRHAEDSKSTASEDTASETQSNTKSETAVISETREASERLQQFLSEVFEDAADYEMPDEAMNGEATVTTSTTVPDVIGLVSECEACDMIREELREGVTLRTTPRRGYKFKKKNRTGWPNSKKRVIVKKEISRSESTEADSKKEMSIERDVSSVEPPDTIEGSTRDSCLSEADEQLSCADTVMEQTVYAADDKLVPDLEDQISMRSEDKSSSSLEDRGVFLRSDDKPLLRSEDRVSSKTEDKPSLRSDDKVSSRSEEKSLVRSEDKPSLRSEDKVLSRLEDKMSSRPEDKPLLRPEDAVSLRSEDKPSLRSEDKVSLRSDDKTSSDVQSSSQSEHKPSSGSQVYEKSSSRSDSLDKAGTGRGRKLRGLDSECSVENSMNAWALQPVVRVARVDTSGAGRMLRSSRREVPERRSRAHRFR